MKRSLYIGSGFLVILIAIGIAAGVFTRKATVEAAAGVMATAASPHHRSSNLTRTAF